MELKDLNDFTPSEVDMEEYEKFKDRLKSYQGEISGNTAFYMADWANRLLDYYSTYYTKAEGYLKDAKTDYDKLFNDVSAEKGENVADGERQAKRNERVIKQKKFIHKVERYVKYLELILNNLEKHHRLMKLKYKKEEERRGENG